MISGPDFLGPYDGLPARDPVRRVKGNDDRHVLRSGSWDLPAQYCRSAFRDSLGPDQRNASIGFRVVLSLD